MYGSYVWLLLLCMGVEVRIAQSEIRVAERFGWHGIYDSGTQGGSNVLQGCNPCFFFQDLQRLAELLPLLSLGNPEIVTVRVELLAENIVELEQLFSTPGLWNAFCRKPEFQHYAPYTALAK